MRSGPNFFKPAGPAGIELKKVIVLKKCIAESNDWHPLASGRPAALRGHQKGAEMPLKTESETAPKTSPFGGPEISKTL